jgi:predicted RND superfamily exporter protein
VLASVAFSVTNVCGYAYFMGLTIEIVTSIILILSVGLALDYAAHMAVCFLVRFNESPFQPKCFRTKF